MKSKICLCFLLMFSISCTGKNDNKVNILEDSNYESGFDLTSTIEGQKGLIARLDYGGLAKGERSKWRIGQWNNINNNLLEASCVTDGSVHRYETANGNSVTVDTDSGVISLQINTESEYGKNGISSNPRKKGEAWPHLLLAQNFPDKSKHYVHSMKSLSMEIDYIVDYIENKMPNEGFDSNLHSIQLAWFITLQNINKNSIGYKDYFWFGLVYYDERYEFKPLYATVDSGGKPHGTNKFIYIPDMKTVLGQGNSTLIGEEKNVVTDVLPLIETGFSLAKESGYMCDTEWKDLAVSSMNIGWEVFGTYNASVEIKSLKLTYN